MYDANDNESFDVSMSVEADGDGYVLTVRADSDWIGESGRAFPVVIDPLGAYLNRTLRMFMLSTVYAQMNPALLKKSERVET